MCVCVRDETAYNKLGQAQTMAMHKRNADAAAAAKQQEKQSQSQTPALTQPKAGGRV